MIYQRTNPVGLDAAIVEYQNYLAQKLGFSNWDNFDRAYMNESSDKGLIPEYYDGGGEYKEVLFNDNVDLSSFFFRSSDVKKVGAGYECDVAWVAQGNLEKLFPLINHRADEELEELVLKANRDYDDEKRFQYQSTEYTIAKVYREFNKEKIRYDDMSHRHCVRFNHRVFYTLRDSMCNT